MREIKFRGKRVDNGKWVYGWLVNDVIWWDKNGKEMDYESIVLETVGQYTGLKDKNGVGIYEGDIVEFDNGFNEDTKSIVIWGETRGGFRLKAKRFGQFGKIKYYALCKNIKVIGNIYEDKLEELCQKE